jgi:hypothetical protein
MIKLGHTPVIGSTAVRIQVGDVVIMAVSDCRFASSIVVFLLSADINYAIANPERCAECSFMLGSVLTLRTFSISIALIVCYLFEVFTVSPPRSSSTHHV